MIGSGLKAVPNDFGRGPMSILDVGNELGNDDVVVRGEMSVGDEQISVEPVAGVEAVLNPIVVIKGEGCVDQMVLWYLGGGGIVRPWHGGLKSDGVVGRLPKLDECQGSEGNAGLIGDAVGAWMVGIGRAMRLGFPCSPPAT